MLHRLLLLSCPLVLAACATAPEPATAPPVHRSTDAEVEALLQRAGSLSAAGRFDESIPLYRRAVELNPGNLRPYEPLAFGYAKLGLFAQAKEWLRERRSRSEEPALDHCFLADLAVRRGDAASARIHTDSLLFLAGEDPPWSLAACAAEIETHLGEHDRAKRRLERAVAQLRREGEPLHGLSFLAFFALRDGETARGEALLAEHEALSRERLARGESVPTMHLDLAAIETLRGDADAAVSHLGEALQNGGWGEYWGGYYYLRADPIFESLRGHPEFERPMAEIRADVERMRARVLAGEDRRVELVERLDSLARAALAEETVAGFSVAVLRGSDTLLLRGYGHADVGLGVPATERTKYRLVSSLPIAALLMRQIERRPISLDHDITPLLPEFPWQGKRVTLRQLMDATSGLTDYHYLGDPHWAEAAVPKSYAEVTALFAGNPFAHEPGERQQWTISGFLLAGILLERLAGQPFGELIEEEVVRPLGLEHTASCNEREIVSNLATGYEAAGDSLLRGRPMSPSMYPFTLTVCASAGDVATLHRALREGRSIRPESYAQMTALSPAGREALERRGRALAAGINVDDLDGHRRTGTVGALAIGSMSAAFDFPGEDLTVVVLTNTYGASQVFSLADNLSRVALGLALPDVEEPEAAPALRNLPISAEDAERYAGTYRVRTAESRRGAPPYERTYRIYRENGRLMIQPLGEVPERLLRQGEYAFARASDPERRIVFTVEDGRASEIAFHEGDRVREKGARIEEATGARSEVSR